MLGGRVDSCVAWKGWLRGVAGGGLDGDGWDGARAGENVVGWVAGSLDDWVRMKAQGCWMGRWWEGVEGSGVYREAYKMWGQVNN